MRAPKSWIAEYAALPQDLTGRELGDALITAGLEVEQIDVVGGEVSGPVVVGRVLDFVEEPQKNGKLIRWCHVDVGPDHAPEKAPEGLRGETVEPLDAGYLPRGIICGAHNFKPGDLVVVSLPGAMLPGGFGIASRKTYGHISDGMICAVDELGLGSDHAGILILPAQTPDGRDWVLGEDALDAMAVRDDVLDMPVTPDMGYCLSIRGLAREASQALDVAFTDPVTLPTPAEKHDGRGVRLETDGCPLFVALTVRGIDPAAATPSWMATRLEASGMRSISLPVDISNYVMLETGQPNHCYDADALTGDITVRQANPGESMVTLDDVERAFDPGDIVIADAAGAVGLAGVMGGQRTEITDATRDVVIEAAHFEPVSIARTSRRQKLSSEASRRFERFVDPDAAYSAAHRVADLLVRFAGGTLDEAETVAGSVPAMPVTSIDADLPSRILGMDVPAERVVSILETSGVLVERQDDRLSLTPPTWRPDLAEPYDYVEEVGTKVGLANLPAVDVPVGTGGGLTTEQKLRRAVTRALATSGLVEVLSFPFSSEAELDQLGVPADDPRRRGVRLANPLADTAPLLRTTMLPGLFGAVGRNASRGNDDVALFEIGRVFFAGNGEASPMLPVGTRPSEAALDALEASLPVQPRHLGMVASGYWTRPGWNTPGVLADWTHALAAADVVASVVGVEFERTAVEMAPWHPGRCAALSVDGAVVGYAGELHPSVVKAFGLPPRTVAAELDVDALLAHFPGAGSVIPISGHPVAKEDIALVVDEGVAVEAIKDAVERGAGELLESCALFDIYRGDPVPEGKKSVAFALRFRASDRTLKEPDVTAARDAAVAEAASRCGAVLRDF